MKKSFLWRFPDSNDLMKYFIGYLARLAKYTFKLYVKQIIFKDVTF
jgi:hypothetical protein